MNSSYFRGEEKEQGSRYYFTYYSEFGDRKGASGVEVVVLALTFVVAVIANLGIAACVLRYKEMRTPTNFCLVNLVVADLFFALGVPAVAYTRITQSWRLGETTCRLLPYSQLICTFVLLWTLTMISIDRHRCLAVPPYRSALTGPRVLTGSLVIWIIGSLIFLPAAFWFKLKHVSPDVTICTMIFPTNGVVGLSIWFTIMTIIIAGLLPMILLVYHYQRIFRRILDTRSRWAVSCVTQSQDSQSNGRRDSALSIVGTLVPWAGRQSSLASVGIQQGRTGSLTQQEEIRLHKHIRVVRILLLNVFVVLVMWIPTTTILLLICIDGHRSQKDTNFFLKSHHFISAFIIAQLNTVVNPLLYGVFSENFRASFAKSWGRGNATISATGSGERCSIGGAVSGGGGACEARKNARSLNALQDRFGASRLAGSVKNASSRPSIASITEVPGSEKL